MRLFFIIWTLPATIEIVHYVYFFPTCRTELAVDHILWAAVYFIGALGVMILLELLLKFSRQAPTR